MVKKNKKFIYVIIIIVSFIFFLMLSINTKKEFYLTKEEEISLYKKSQEGDIKAIDKLYKYYHYSINDYNKSIYILKMRLGGQVITITSINKKVIVIT